MGVRHGNRDHFYFHDTRLHTGAHGISFRKHSHHHPHGYIHLSAVASLLIFYTVLQYKTIVYTAFDADFAHTRGIKTRLVNYIMTFFVATAVVLTIRLVGIMLLISILSLPQMIAELFCHKFRNIVWLSGAINLLCGIGGLLLSYWLDVPAGATIVFTLIIAYFVVKIIASYLHSATGKKQ